MGRGRSQKKGGRERSEHTASRGGRGIGGKEGGDGQRSREWSRLDGPSVEDRAQ